MPSRIFSFFVEIAFSAFSTNFRRANALVGDRLVGIDHESIGKRDGRLKLLGHLLGAERDHRHLVIFGIARKVVELVAQRVAGAAELVLGDPRALVLDLEDVGENLGEGAELPFQFRGLFEPRPVGGTLHGSDDGVLQSGFRRQRRLAVLLLAGHHEIAGQRPVGDQLAVDVARQIGLVHAALVGIDPVGNPLEAEIGEAHAGGRDRQHDGKAKHDLGAEPQSGEPERRTATFQKSHVIPPFSF